VRRPARAALGALLALLALQPLPGSPGTSLAFAGDDESIQHFHTGVRLFQDHNFSGALAEFEEAYRLRPAASALQNIALCQKALFRYAEAIATLERMLDEHGASLAPDDAQAARAAIDEMRPLVATVTLGVSPPDAELTIDGRPVRGGAERQLHLNVGEHRIVADAPLHRRFEQLVSFAGGSRRLEINLESDTGELSLTVDDPEAAIAVDGVPRGFGAWRGELSTSAPHVIQIYKKGHAPTELKVSLEKGEKRELRAALGPVVKGDGPAPFPYTPPPPPPQKRGLYGFLTATTYYIGNDPDGFKVPQGNGGGRDGSFFGARAGYRLTNTFGLEAMFEAGKHTVGPGCYTPSKPDFECKDPIEQPIIYDRWAQRFGVGGRVFSRGDSFRFIAASAVGAVRHQVKIPDNPEKSGEGTGYNAFFEFEGGVEVQFGKVMVNGVLALAIDGASNLAVDKSGERFYTNNRNVGMAGLGLRVGWGQW
jgi:hypothetical protein